MRISDWSSDVCSFRSFRLFPSLTVSETFDDNIFAEENGEQVDLITAVTGAVVARSEWTRHDFTFDARVRHEKFLDNAEQDRTEYFLRPRVKFELDGRETATINDRTSVERGKSV